MRANLLVSALIGVAFVPLTTSVSAARSVANPATIEPATIDIEMSSGGERLWTGSLRLAAPHGSASYSQSKNEFAGTCNGAEKSRNTSSNENLRLNINRRNYNQQVDQFSINVNWTQPVAPCEGGGSNTVGFERPVTLPPGGSATVVGTGGVTLRLTRR